jgi:hypothetical protein
MLDSGWTGYWSVGVLEYWTANWLVQISGVNRPLWFCEGFLKTAPSQL